MQHQDWNPTVIKNKNADTLAKAQREGRTKVVKKYSSDNAHMKKIENEDDVKPIDKVGHDISILIQQARMAKKWTQKELAQKANIKPDIIRDVEAGKAKLDNQVLLKLQRVLGVSLLGKKL